MDSHQLKREIIGTVLTSQIVDRMGATFMMRMNEDTGADVSAIALAYFLVVELFNLKCFCGKPLMIMTLLSMPMNN